MWYLHTTCFDSMENHCSWYEREQPLSACNAEEAALEAKRLFGESVFREGYDGKVYPCNPRVMLHLDVDLAPMECGRG